jgi:hypothetical protein
MPISFPMPTYAPDKNARNQSPKKRKKRIKNPRAIRPITIITKNVPNDPNDGIQYSLYFIEKHTGKQQLTQRLSGLNPFYNNPVASNAGYYNTSA